MLGFMLAFVLNRHALADYLFHCLGTTSIRIVLNDLIERDEQLSAVESHKLHGFCVDGLIERNVCSVDQVVANALEFRMVYLLNPQNEVRTATVSGQLVTRPFDDDLCGGAATRANLHKLGLNHLRSCSAVKINFLSLSGGVQSGSNQPACCIRYRAPRAYREDPAPNRRLSSCDRSFAHRMHG